MTLTLAELGPARLALSRRATLTLTALTFGALAFAATLGGASSARAEAIKVAVTPGPHAQILEAVKPVAARKGLDITIVEFSDYVVPNAALASGEIEANSFQHKPYLDNQIADRGYDLTPVAFTVNFPIGIYSKTLKSIEALPQGATLAIPNDPTNGGRVLLLLADKGLITLAPNVGVKASVVDITKNPRQLKFLEIDAAQLPRALPDVDAAGINTNYAKEAGLDPVKDPILREDPKGPYVNLIAVRTADKDKPWVKTLVESYQSPEVKSFILETFKGAVLPSW